MLEKWKSAIDNRKIIVALLFVNLELLHFTSRTVNHGSESVTYLGSKIWEIIPAYTKELDTTDKFKIAIKKWKPESCPCRLCRVYLLNICYL